LLGHVSTAQSPTAPSPATSAGSDASEYEEALEQARRQAQAAKDTIGAASSAAPSGAIRPNMVYWANPPSAPSAPAAVFEAKRF